MTSTWRLRIVLACVAFAWAVSLAPAAMAQSGSSSSQGSLFGRWFPWFQTQRPVQRVAEAPREQVPAARPCPECRILILGVAW